VAETLIVPAIEFKCDGKMSFGTENIEVEYQIKQMQNGRIIGNLATPSKNYPKIDTLFRSRSGYFKLEGVDNNGSEVKVDRCFLNSLHWGTDPKTSGRFVAYEILVNSSKFDEQPSNEVVVRFGLLNIDETFRVKVDTKIGKLFLRPIKEKEDKLFAIKNLGISGVTAIAEIFVEKTAAQKPYHDILKDSIDIIDGFLCISRLADTCFHDWCSVTIYQKDDKLERHNFILQSLRSPKLKNPHYRGLTNPAHSFIFYEKAYSGYKGREKELDDYFDFRIALEWYLEANIASVLESQYLMACTCLELLVDRFQHRMNSEFIMDDNVFKEKFVPDIRSYARKSMKSLEISADQRGQIYANISGINRRSRGRGISELIAYLRIKHDDLLTDLNDVLRIRNLITHTGTYGDVDELSKVFNALYVLLSRIFLKILNYDDDYFDWVKGDWVHFREIVR
jgi:hypothetical protein